MYDLYINLVILKRVSVAQNHSYDFARPHFAPSRSGLANVIGVRFLPLKHLFANVWANNVWHCFSS